MNRKALTAFVIPAVLAATLGTALAAEKVIQLNFGTVQLAMPVPQGFCEPTGVSAELAKANAAIDSDNTTLATLTACDRSSATEPFQNYVLIKAPNKLLNQPFLKVMALAQLDEVFSGPNSPKFDDAMSKKTGDNSERELGTRIEISGQFGYVGRDRDCVYLAGPVQAKAAEFDKVATGQIATCITVVGNRMFSVNLYEVPAVKPIGEMKKQALAIALSIHR